MYLLEYDFNTNQFSLVFCNTYIIIIVLLDEIFLLD